MDLDQLATLQALNPIADARAAARTYR